MPGKLTLSLIILAAAMMACNLPAGPTPTVLQPPTQAILPPVDPVQSATQSVQPPPTAPLPPTEVVIQSNLPTVTMDGGTGYIFSSGQLTHDDRDIWWNALQFVPASGYRMVSLGIINSPADVGSLTFANESPQVFEPVLGEGFGVEITRDNQKTYAVIRVLRVDGERRISFDWVYPFNGAVTINP